MAVTSIWAIKRSLSEVINYVKNPDKTTSENALSDVISYAVNSEKTIKTDDESAENVISYVTGINCYSETSIDEMVLDIKEKENYTTLEELPPLYKDAVIAVEDHRFYEHNGIDIFATTKALIKDIKAEYDINITYTQKTSIKRGDEKY